MAIAHLNANLIRRPTGGSGAQSLAYMCGRNLTDVWSGQRYWYARRTEREEVLAVGMGRYVGLDPSWNIDDAQLLAERFDYGEKRADACIGRDFEGSIPHELPPFARKALAQDFADYLSARYRTAVPYAVHAPPADGDERNAHIHTLVPDRRVGDDGVSMGAKLRELSALKTRAKELLEIRLAWQHLVNWHLQEAQSDARIYMGRTRSAGNRSIHLGPPDTGEERRRQNREGRSLDGRGVLAHVSAESSAAARRAARQRPEPCPVPRQVLVRPDPSKLPIVVEEEQEDAELPRPRARRARRPRTRLTGPADVSAANERVERATQGMTQAVREATAELDGRPPRTPRKRRRAARRTTAPPPGLANAEDRVVEATHQLAEATREATPERAPRAPRKRRTRVRAVTPPPPDLASAGDRIDDARHRVLMARVDEELQKKKEEVKATAEEIERAIRELRDDPQRGDLRMGLWHEVDQELARREKERAEGKNKSECEEARRRATAMLVCRWAPGPLASVRAASSARLAAHRVVQVATVVEKRIESLEKRHRPKWPHGRRRYAIGRPWPYWDPAERKRRRRRKPKAIDEAIAEKLVEIAADFLGLLFGLIVLNEIAEGRTQERGRGRGPQQRERGKGADSG